LEPLNEVPSFKTNVNGFGKNKLIFSANMSYVYVDFGERKTFLNMNTPGIY
jgi:hypothetical protein